MRIPDTLTVGLIAGILSFTIADEVVLRRNAGVPSHIPMLGYVNTTAEDIVEFDKKLCEGAGGPTAHEELINSTMEFKTCWESLADDVQRNVMIPSLSAFYKGICYKLPSFESCFKTLTDSMKTCLDVSKHETADILYNTFSSTARFLCEDEAARIVAFLSPDGITCIQRKTQDVKMCLNHTIYKYVKDNVPDGAALGGLGTLHLLVPNVEKCTVFNNFQTCAVDALKDCPDQTISERVKPIMDVVRKSLTCDHILGKSKASPASVVNVLLVTAASAFISLQFA